MSRIGRLPVPVPADVKVDLKGSQLIVKGPRGELEREFSPEISITFEDGVINVTRHSEQPTYRALHGTTRALINNMIVGVSAGFTRVLEIDGVGYRAELDGEDLMVYVGYSHPVKVTPPAGITFDVDTRARQIKVNGYDKQMVGQVASNIRDIRPPEPYKGKGIHYLGERIRRKAGKSGKAQN